MKSLFRLFLIVLFIIAAFVHNAAAQDTVVNIATTESWTLCIRTSLTRNAGYRCSFPPDISREAAQNGVTDSSFEIGKLPRKDHYALVIDGLFESKEDGYYRFYLDGGDKETKLYLDHKLLINFNEDGAFGQDAIVPLSKGFYPFRIEYLRKSNTPYELFWQYLLTPGIMESQNSILIPVNQEYGKR